MLEDHIIKCSKLTNEDIYFLYMFMFNMDSQSLGLMGYDPCEGS